MHMSLFYFLCYFGCATCALTTEREEPNTSKVPDQDPPNLTKAGFVIAINLQLASGCKDRLISKPV